MIYKPQRNVDAVFLHCSASDAKSHDDIAVIDKWHRALGWSEVGYHFFIKKDGTLQAGRSLEKTPAAQRGYNARTIAICVHGLRDEKFTDEQFKMLQQLCIELNDLYEGELTFHGHCEISPKLCPVFDYKTLLQIGRDHKLGL